MNMELQKSLAILIAYAVYVGVARIDAYHNYTESSCDTTECTFLYNEVIKNLNFNQNPCDNFYFYVCSNVSTFNNNLNGQNNENYQEKLEKDVSDILRDTPPSDTRIKSLAIEIKLYQKCLKFGRDRDYSNNQNRLHFKKVYSLISSLDQLAKNISWQSIDKQIYRLGFDYAFFNVRVVQDPHNLQENIILLEPPSIASLISINDMLKIVLRGYVMEHYNKNIDNLEEILNFYKYVTRTLKEPIENFFDSWMDAVNYTSVNDYIQFPNKKLNIQQWNREYNERDYRTKTAQINWKDILAQMFSSAGVKINSSQSIIVKNEPYFTRLYYLLADTPNNVTAVITVLKAVTEHLRYVDWNLAYMLKPVEKFSFCFYETKLYAISYTLLDRFKLSPNFEKLRNIVQNIIKSLHYEIYHSQTLSYKTESYLVSELEKITMHFFHEYYDIDRIANYYEDLHETDSYLDTILDYRRVLKEKEYSMIKKNSTLIKYMPFSLSDQSNPANRLMLNVYLMNFSLSRSTLSMNLPNEYYYGTYGTKIASLMYALLNENKFEDLYRYNNKLSAHPEYSHDAIICLIPESGEYAHKFGPDTVSQLYGLRIAYKAMKYLYLDENYVPMKNSSSSNAQKVIYIDQFFFLTYARSQCGDSTRNRIINTALSNNEHFMYEFQCNTTRNYEDLKCGLEAFDSPNNRIYLTKL